MSRAVVLNTRPREQAAELSQLLHDADFAVIEAPAVGIEAVWDAVELEHIRQDLHSGVFDWVVLPSQNAGRDLVEHLEKSPVRVACGTSTAMALGLDRIAIALTRFSATHALDSLRPLLVPGERILVPRAAEGRDELVRGLRALGAIVDDPVAYRTVAVDDAAKCLRRGGIDVVTLCSPSAARSVASSLHDELVACLGETTARAAREMGLRVHATAQLSSMAALVEAVMLTLGVRV